MLPYLVIGVAVFSLRLKFGIRGISSLIYDNFWKDRENSSLNMTIFDQFSY